MHPDAKRMGTLASLPEAELRIVQAGHSSFDPSLSEALVKAVEDIRSKL